MNDLYMYHKSNMLTRKEDDTVVYLKGGGQEKSSGARC